MKLVNSFRYAFRGIYYLFKQERNAQIEAIAAVFVISLSFYFNISATEWLIVLLSCFIVLSAEAFNTALEKLVDHLHPELHPSIGLVKDLSAGAVLILALSALISAAMIFIPYLKTLLT